MVVGRDARVCKGVVAFWITLGVIVGGVSPVAADPVRNGLAISPVRSETKVDAGKSTTGYVTIGNLTDKNTVVSLQVKEFSVADYTYDYEFHTPKNDWLKLSEPQIELEPHTSKKVAYTIAVPQKVAPGGYYFSLVASTSISGSGLPVTVQAASLVYLKVSGKLIQTGVMLNDSLPFLVTGNTVPYKFDVKDTGNIYFSSYFYGKIDGLFGIGSQPETGTSHLLIPNVVRTITGTIPSPLLPGIYRVTYGYRVDFTPIVVTKSAYILFIPPWSVAALVLVLLTARWVWQKRHKRAESTKDS